MAKQLTDFEVELLKYLSTRSGVVPIHKKHTTVLNDLHALGFVATHGLYAQITDEGRAALQEAGRS
jgi:hypothetical protein